jgi:hypothetical protein
MIQRIFGHFFAPPFLDFTGKVFHPKRGLGFPDQVVDYILQSWFSRHLKLGEKAKALFQSAEEGDSGKRPGRKFRD